MEKVVIGARGSRLSIAQTQIVVDRIKRSFPKLAVEIRVIKTYGDMKKGMKLDSMEQKGVFVKDIDRQLADGQIDLAVHSLKDIPTKLPDSLKIGAIVERSDPRDVLISRDNSKLRDLKRNAKIGTSSLRRMGQLLAFRKDLKVVEMRGNVDKRVAKLDSGDYDAIVLAAAGIKRLGLEKRISEYLPFGVMLPAPGQGALAVEIRSGDRRAEEIARRIDDAKVRASVEAERIALSRIGGGCNALLGVLAGVRGDKLNMSAAITSRDGKRKRRYTQRGLLGFPEEAGLMLAEKILMSDVADIIGDKRPYSPLSGKVVLVTREEAEGEGICQMLLERGAVPVYFPTIKTVDIDSRDSGKKLDRLNKYDVVVITSRRGASRLLGLLKYKGMRMGLAGARVVAIGTETKRYLEGSGVPVDYVPDDSYSREIVCGLKGIKGRRILVINSARAGNGLVEGLASKGGKVDRMTPYTVTKPDTSGLRRKAILGYKFDFVTFASPSAVEGLIAILGERNAKKVLSKSKVVCIGDTTSKKCSEEGIRVHAVSEVHSLSGIVDCMERSG